MNKARKYNAEVKKANKALTDQIYLEILLYGHAIVFHDAGSIRVLGQKELEELVKWRKKNIINLKKKTKCPK